MKQSYLSAIGLGLGLMLTGCLVDNSSALQGGDSETSGGSLSANATAIFEKVQTIEKAIWEAREVICPRDSTLHEKVKAELDAIRQDSSLSEEERKEAGRAVHETYRTELEADRTQVEECAGLHAEDWTFLKETSQSVHKACVPPPPKGKRDRKRGGKPARSSDRMVEGNRPPPPEGGDDRPHPKPEFGDMSSEEIAAWETLLTSEACAAAIDSAYSELKI